jgi:putative membrane protein
MDYYKLLTFASSLSILVSGVLIVFGVIEIKTRKRIHIHRNFMISATFFATLFLLLYFIKYIAFGQKHYHGSMREIYLIILFFHSFLAVLNIPFALFTLYFALRRRFDLHKKVAKITAPIWIVVALTGWIIFIFLTFG